MIVFIFVLLVFSKIDKSLSLGSVIERELGAAKSYLRSDNSHGHRGNSHGHMRSHNQAGLHHIDTNISGEMHRLLNPN